ncbi:PilZ domain-containing protein [uncultured Ferrimonas sp.]|uniref:PilZ domain-containing protein n=1 Tax=uncultured Ferrimonas sp. TaxID=432640 RepID=UPI00262C082C|nr:PilZ domain-containing protein [uncultured Ferrimonas sp.]
MEQHQALIEQLKPILQHDDFDNLFEQVTQDLPRTDRFLLKMEVNRLNQSSNQSIDLRNKVTAPCEQVEVGGVVHFLTQPLRQQLQQLVKLYGNRLTVGAVEELLANVRKPQAIAPSSELTNNLNVGEMEMMALGYYVMRREVRRTFSTEIALWQNANQKQVGLTLDLSVGGCKVRTDPEFRIAANHPITVHFTALSKEFVLPVLDHGLQYQLVHTESRRGYQYLRLRRINGNEAQDQELERVLQANSLRTVPEINHLLATTRSHGYERHLLPTIESLAVAFKEAEQQLQPLITLQTQRNQECHNYWCNEEGISQLAAILSHDRIARLQQCPDNLAHGLLYSFHIQQQGQTLFFSATLAELQQINMVDAFLQMAASQPSFRLHQLAQHSVNQIDLNRALRNPISSQPFEPLVLQQMLEASLLVTIQPLPIEPSCYQQRIAGQDPNQLRRFGMIRQHESSIRTIASLHQDLRREARFNLSTIVRVSQGFTTSMDAQSVDISPHGMRLQFASSHPFKADKPVEVELPQLQQMAGKIKLTGLPYEVVGDSPDRLTIRLHSMDGKPHNGQKFIADLLEKNSDQLMEVSSSKQHRQLVESIKNLTLPRLPGLPFFVHKRNNHCVADLIGCSNAKLPLLSKLNPQGKTPLSLQWLLSHPPVAALVAAAAKLAPLQAQTLQLAIALPQPNEPAQFMAVEQADPVALRKFLLKTIAQKRLLGLQIELHGADKPDLDYLQADLSAISGHALHRARELEAVLWQVQGCGMMLDISAELLCRAGLEGLLPAHAGLT